MNSETREFGGLIYLNCNHHTEQEMARLHGLPVVSEPAGLDVPHAVKVSGIRGAIHRLLTKAVLRWCDKPIVGRCLWWAFDLTW